MNIVTKWFYFLLDILPIGLIPNTIEWVITSVSKSEMVFLLVIRIEKTVLIFDSTEVLVKEEIQNVGAIEESQEDRLYIFYGYNWKNNQKIIKIYLINYKFDTLL